MKTLSLVLAALSSVAFAQPEISRPSLDRIVITGADYAGTQPEAERIMTGIPLSFGFAWVEISIPLIVFSVDPYTEYTVHAFTVDSSGWPEEEPIREETVQTLGIDRQARLNWAIYQVYRAQRELEQTIQDLDPEYFEISEAQAHARVRLENEQ